MVQLAPPGWKEYHQQAVQDVQPDDAEAANSVSDKKSRSTWAKLIAQVYEVDPLLCPCRPAPMRILASEKGVRVMVKGQPKTDEVIPLAALKESLNKAAYTYTEKHLGPKEEVANKGDNLSNRLGPILKT